MKTFTPTTNCKKTAFAFLAALFCLITSVKAQVANYGFSQAIGTYTAISGTTAIANGWDDAVTANNIPIGFSFVFNGTTYTTCSVNSNGYITFGSTISSSTSYTPISSSTGYAGTIAALARDLVNNGSAIIYTTLNSSPNRVFVVQWTNARRFSGSSRASDFDFQIRLNETTNIIQVVYGDCASNFNTDLLVQVGLRGASNADFNNRTTTNNWPASTAGATNAATCNTGDGAGEVPSNGLTYTWYPPPTITSFSPSSGCANTTPVTITGTNFTGATAVTFGGTNAASFTVNSATQITATPAAGATGTIKITTPGGTATSGSNFTVNQLPTITTTGIVAAVCFSAGAQTTTMPYSATTNSPTSYSIVWTGIANQGSTAFAFAAGGGTVTGIVIPAGTAAGTYNGTMTITNGNGCTANQAISLTVNQPTITTTGIATTVCFSAGAQTTTMPYNATTNSPTSYSIAWTGIANQGSTAFAFAAGGGTVTGIVIPAGTAAGTYNGTMTITNASGCTGTHAISVTIGGLPTITTTGTVVAVCFSAGAQTTTMPYTATTNSPTSYSIAWTGIANQGSTAFAFAAGGGTVTGIVIPAGTAAGTYNGTMTITTGNGCTATQAISFTVNSLPTITTTGTVVAVCFSAGAQTTTMPYSATTNSPTSYSIAWTGIANQGSTAFAFAAGGGTVTGIVIPAGTAAGTYNGTMTITNGNGCTANQAISLTVNQPTITTTGIATTVCFSAGAQTTTMPYSATTNSPTSYSIAWIGIANQGSTAFAFAAGGGTVTGIVIPAGTAAGTYNGTMTITNASGCTGTHAISVTIGGLPTITTTGTVVAVCFSAGAQTTTMPYTATTNSPTSYSIAWTGIANQGSTAFAFAAGGGTVTGIVIPAGTAAGTYNGTMTITTGNGCTATQAISFTVNSLPTITTTGTVVAVCFSAGVQNTTMPYTATTNSPTSYSIVWTGIANQGNTAFAFAAGGGTVTGIVIPAGTAAGTYNGTMTITNGNGCTATQAISVAVNSLPTITTTGIATTVCFSAGAQTTTMPYSATTNSPTSYSIAWTGIANQGSTAFAFAAGGGTVTGIVIPAGTAAGTYNGTMTITNASGCTGTHAISVTIGGLPTITTTGTVVAVCFSAGAQTTTMPYTATTNSPTSYSIAWTGIANQGSTAFAFAAGGGTVTGIVIPAGTAAGTYNGTMTITTGNGCTATQAISVTVNSLPTITTTGIVAAVCFSAGAQTTTMPYSATTNSPTSYSIVWTGIANQGSTAFAFAAGGGTVTGIVIPAGTAAGTYNGTMTITNGNGCTATQAISVTVNSLPTITTTGIATTVCFSAGAQTTTMPYTATTNSPTSYSIAWTGIANQGSTAFAFAAGGGTVTGIVIPAGTAAGTYNGTMTITNASGCTGTHAISVTVNAFLNGTYNVGIGQTYTTLTAAINAYNTACLGGPVTFILTNATYTTPLETFPIIINANSNASSTNTLTIKPNTLLNPIITGSSTSAIIQFNGADYVTIDGSNTIGGTTNNLNIINTNTGTSSSAVTFINGATNNTIQYTTVQAAGLSASTAVIVFSTAGTTGNNNNTITSSNINGGSVCPDGIYSSGSAALPNTSNTISNNNIYDNFSSTLGGAAIYLAANTSTWTITGNKFYQSANRAMLASNVGIYGIEIGSNSGTTSGNGYTITNNIIGGSNSSGGGAPTTYTGSFDYSYVGIYLNTTTTTVSSIQGNTITNISVSNAPSSGTVSFAGITADAGQFNIGTTTGNTIGASSGTGAITVTSNNNSSYIEGIDITSSSTASIQNNTISSIGTGNNSRGYVFEGIFSGGSGSFTISNNQVGSNTASAIRIGTSGTTNQDINAVCIDAQSSGTQTISNNTINNVTAYSSSSFTYLDGLAVSNGTVTVSKNVISNLTTNTSNVITGMYLATSSGTSTISQNKIYGITGSNSSIDIYGLEIVSGAWNINNNMISIINSGSTNAIYGIYDIAILSTLNIYFNSIYIGGTASNNTSTACYYRFFIGFNTINFKDNILVNARTGGSGTHYALDNEAFLGTFGLTSDYNIFNAPNISKVMRNVGTDYSFAGWKSATGLDNNSNPGTTGTPGNIVFQDPTNGDLHLVVNQNCGVDGKGVTISGITIDYDGDTRPNPAPNPDIGADEFIGVGLPAITGSNNVCAGGTTTTQITLSNATSGGTWSSSDITKATINGSGVVTGIAAGPVTISYTYGSCVATYGVTVNPLPTAPFSGSSTNTCYGATATLTITGGTPNAFVDYTINGGAQPQVQLNASGNYTFTTGAITSPTTYTITKVTNSTTGCAQVPIINNTFTVSITSVSGTYTWTGFVNADWNNKDNWCSDAAPISTGNVIIPVVSSGNYPVISTANATAASVTINSGALLTMSGIYNLTISNLGTFTNNGAFNATASTTGAVVFLGTGTVGGTTATTFKNITINGALTLNTAPTISGNFQINSGAVSTNSPTYGNASTLIYNTSGAYSTGNEWNAGAAGTTVAGSGIPQNVTIQSGTVTLNTGAIANRALAGNLIISAGTTFQLAAGANPNLYILGNWTNNGGTFNANAKTVTFNAIAASTTQTIAGTTIFYNLTFGNSNVTTDFGSSTTTVANQFNNNAGTMVGSTSTVILTGNLPGTIIGGAAKNFYNLQINSGAVITHTTAGGNIHVANSFVNNGSLTENSAYTFFFDKSTATESFTGTGTTTFGNLTIGDGSGLSFATTLNASANFTVTGGSMAFFHNSIYTANNNTATFSGLPATISGSGTANFYNAITTVALNPGSGISTFNNNLQVNTGGSIITNAPVYGNAATLIYNTANAGLNTNIEWQNNTGIAGGAGAPLHVTVLNDNIVLPGSTGSRTVPGILNLGSSSTLNINGNTLTVNSGFAGTGNLKGSLTSNLIAGGMGTISFNSSANYLKDFTINNAANLTLGNALNIAASNGAAANTFGTVTVGSGGMLNANGNLTLKSDAYGDAIIGQSSGSINNYVTVERFILGGKRAWRFLSVPTNNSTLNANTINYFWQENNVPNPDIYTQDNIKPGYGTDITYTGPGNGFDANLTSTPSIRYWDNAISGGGWNQPASTYLPISQYPAYCLFVRGSRAVDLWNGVYATIKDNTILRTTGTLNVGAYSLNYATTAGKPVLISNPYAAPVDIKMILMANSSKFTLNKFWVWDPSYSGNYGVGGYLTYSNGFIIPAGSGYNASNIYAQSGQAFMLEALNTAANTPVSFAENQKFTSEFSVTRQAGPPYAAIFTNLLTPSGDSLALVGGVGAAFANRFSADVDADDAQKLWNFDENIALVRGESTLAIEFRPVPKLTDTLFYRLYLRQQPYTLQIFSGNLPADLPAKAWLVDKYLNTQTEVNLYDTTLYNFTPNTDTMSYRNRFMLVFNRVDDVKPISSAKSITGSKINSTGSSGNIVLYPNPVSTSKVSMQFNNMVKGDYAITVINIKGEQLAERTIQHGGGTAVYALPLNASWAAGVYTVNVLNKYSKEKINLQLVISK